MPRGLEDWLTLADEHPGHWFVLTGNDEGGSTQNIQEPGSRLRAEVARQQAIGWTFVDGWMS